MCWRNIFNNLFHFCRESTDDQRKHRELADVYKRQEEQTRRFQKSSGLRCLSGCGQCCENPYIETTVFEMMPLAEELWNSGKAEEYLEKIENVGGEGRCVLFEPHPTGGGRGRCGQYRFRPLICRLFGFAAKTDKSGSPQLVTCSVIKQNQLREYEIAQKALACGGEVPIMSDYAQEIARIDPYEGVKQLPLNTALRLALEKTGLRRKMSSRTC